jgi:RHS repeat-associated protein
MGAVGRRFGHVGNTTKACHQPASGGLSGYLVWFRLLATVARPSERPVFVLAVAVDPEEVAPVSSFLSCLIGAVCLKASSQGSALSRKAVWLAGLVVVALLVLPAVAAAAVCTDTWKGPAEGPWGTAADWSAGHVPTSSDVVCIGSGSTVGIVEAATAGVLQVEGTLAIGGGSLEVTNALEASSVAALSMAGGSLSGAATVDVSGSFSAGDGGLGGSGSLVILSGASATIGGEETFVVIEGEYTLVNEGTLTVEKGHISMSGKARIVNSGTIDANSESGGGAFRGGNGAGKIVNTGLFHRTAGGGQTIISPEFENLGTIAATTGVFRFTTGNDTWANGSVLEGTVEVFNSVTADNFDAHNLTLELDGVLTVTEGNFVKVRELYMKQAELEGAGTVEVAGSLTVEGGLMKGPGSIIILHGATALIGPSGDPVMELAGRKFVNEGVVTFSNGHLNLSEGALLENINTFKADSEVANTSASIGLRESASIQNHGLFEKKVGKGNTTVVPFFYNTGAVVPFTGKLEFSNPVHILTASEFAERNPSAPHRPQSKCGDPVNCATGNFYETQTDLAVGGRGVGLDLTRTYNAIAGAEGASGVFGHGWSSSFSDHLVVEESTATVFHGNGSAVSFAQSKSGVFTAPEWTQDKLTGSSGAGYSLVMANQLKYQFDGGTGRLQSVSDRNGNQTKLAYNKAGQLETITDPAGRKITLVYNGEGLVESAKDPMGHTVKYTYESGTLASVTLPGEAKPRWQYHYDESHQMTSITDGRGGKTTNEYDGSHRVTTQTDPAEHKLKFEYEAFHTVVTNNGTGSVTDEWFNSSGEPTRITRGFGTESASTESFFYDAAGNLLSRTDGDEHTTEYTYDSQGNMLSMIDPNKHETKWTYNQTHDILTTTVPKGETTTVTRDAHGNAETISRPAPGKSTQTTSYAYDANGNVKSMVDPLKHTWSYEYDNQGDRTSMTDPEGNKSTYGYDEDSNRTSMVSPAGNVKGAEAGQYTSKTERDAQERPTTVTDPLGHTVKHAYDGNGNLETLTDSLGHTTTYTYNADDQLTKVKEPTGATTETAYNSAGQETSHTDGNKHTTTYTRNILGETTEIKDPLGRVTKNEYDTTGNLTAVTDAAGRTAKYSYDPASELIEVAYSDGKTPAVKYEYDADGNRTKMTDGTGETGYTYDLLDRLVQNTDGHGDKTGYEYDLAGNQTKLTYPNGTLITRAFDNAGRLQSVTDPSKNTTTFVYDSNSNLTTTTFPKATGEQDKISYSRANQELKVTMTGSGLKALASVAYSRDNNGQVKTTTTTGLPGTESTTSAYDANNRLTSTAGTVYEYDSADNPTKIGATTYAYDAGSQLETGGTTSYGYDQLGERTTSTPKAGQTTTYGYDQAGNLTQVKQGKTGINDSYAYDGNGLRVSQTKGKTTTFLTWDVHTGLPVVVSDEQNTYIYGPGSIPIEQIQSKGTTLYLHHDQQGSTRMLTSSTGAIEAATTYDAYGNSTATKGTTTTPLGYDAQYTNADTGLIYLRARAYDPATAQFLSTDPLTRITHTPYTYAAENPLNYTDPTGQDFIPIPIEFCFEGPEAVAGCALLGAGAAVGGAILGHEAAENVTRSVEGETEEASEIETDCSAEISIYDNPNRNPAQDKLLSKRDIELLERNGYDLHGGEKSGGARSDLYKDANGNVYEKPKGGAGPGEPINANLNHLRGR